MQLAKFIYSAIKDHNTSLGNNKAFPHREDVSFEYVVLKRRYKQVIEQIQEVFGYLPKIEDAESLLSKLITYAQRLEKPLRPQLEKLCEAVVNNVLGVPQETILLECNLVSKIEPEEALRILPEYDEDEPTYDFEDVDEIAMANDAILKRRIMNSLVQGVSYYLMMDNFDSSQLSEWSDELADLYLQIIVLNDYLLFSKQEKISDKAPMLGAYVETHLGKGNQKTIITAQGLIYPLLLQETFRGFFELFASHGLPDDTEAAKYIIQHADFVVAEAWDLRMGVPLWSAIEHCMSETPEASVYPYIFASLAQLPIKEFNKTLQNLFSNTKYGKNYINDIINEVNHDKEYNLFKQDIEKFNLEKCVISETDDELINEEDDNNVESNESNSQIHAEQINPNELFRLAIEEFGITSLLSQAGYILPNGQLLNFGAYGDRDTDHRAIEAIYKGNNIQIWSDEYRYNYVVDFLNHGAIRIDVHSGLIDMTTEPTDAEYAVLKMFARKNRNAIYMDFTDKRGNVIHSVDYYNVNPQRLVSDIMKFYREGLKPLGDIDESTKHKHILRESNDDLISWFQGSYVVNQDGSPKVMYRGDRNETTTFDRAHSSPHNLYGTGFYFTESKSHASQYGNVQPYYLKITHPLSTKGHEITKQQLYKFLVAVDENEDYGLYNYGYGANPKTVLNSVWGKSDFVMLQDINATCIGDLVEATLLFNQLNGTDFDGFILDTETVVFDNSQIRKANITEAKQYIIEGN